MPDVKNYRLVWNTAQHQGEVRFETDAVNTIAVADAAEFAVLAHLFSLPGLYHDPVARTLSVGPRPLGAHAVAGTPPPRGRRNGPARPTAA